MNEALDNNRLMVLLKKAVEHIEEFEEDQSENVLKDLGFTEDDLAVIRRQGNFTDPVKSSLLSQIQSASSRTAETYSADKIPGREQVSERS